MAEGPEMALQGSEGRAVALPGRPHPCAALLSAVSSAMGMNTPVPSPAPPLGGRPPPPSHAQATAGHCSEPTLGSQLPEGAAPGAPSLPAPRARGLLSTTVPMLGPQPLSSCHVTSPSAELGRDAPWHAVT